MPTDSTSRILLNLHSSIYHVKKKTNKPKTLQQIAVTVDIYCEFKNHLSRPVRGV
jgi:hypothetical protein